MKELIFIFDSLLEKSKGNIKGYCFAISKDLEKHTNKLKKHKDNKIVIVELLPENTVIYCKYTDIYDV
jgi:hypothetical protein